MKKIIVVIICVICLCGCKEQQEEVVEYNDNNLRQEKLTESASLVMKNNLFSTDLCVIPRERNNSIDTQIGSDAALLINITDRKCLFAKNIYAKMYPASITKLTTALVVLNNPELLAQTVTISKNASSITEAGAKLCGFQEGDQINMEDLVKSMLVYSGNDAALAIAEHVSESESNFAKKMNETVESLGANFTHYVNSHGLHNDMQYTSPYDLYLIFNEVLKHKQIYDMFGLKSYRLNYLDRNGRSKTKVFEATNKFLLGTVNAPNGVRVLGGKTGTTDKAGACLILYSKDQNNKEYISVVLKANSSMSLYREMSHLLSYIK